MKPDRLSPGERGAAGSISIFEGQGLGGGTHLLSPAIAAAVTCRLTNVRDLL